MNETLKQSEILIFLKRPVDVNVWNLTGILWFTFPSPDTCTCEIFVSQNIFPDLFLISGLCSFVPFLFRSNMDANSSSEQEKSSPTKKLIKPPKRGKEENRERKLRFRHLTDEILEKYRR